MRHPEWLHELEINFQSVSKVLFSSLKPDEELSISLAAERSTFVRVNSAKIRQNTFVEQAFVSLSLQNGKQSYKASFPLYFQRDADENRALQFLQLAREQMVVADPDPFQVPFTDNGTSRDVFTGELLNDSEVFNAILAPAKGSDIAGLYASGPVVAASCNSKGQNHWFATESFFFDYSIFDGPRA
ncbi:MAG: Zn-dependent protease, partial [Pseudobdellovibrionaceae bacterium]